MSGSRNTGGSSPPRKKTATDVVPLQSVKDAAYERPYQDWKCGHECGPCILGPTALGGCIGGPECQPRQHNDSWICNRSKLQGGQCEGGPTAEGECCQQRTACVPVRSTRSRRFQFVLWCVAGMIGLGTFMLNSDWRNDVLAPGPLTEQHAQLLRDKEAGRCAECHAAGATDMAGLANWTLAALVAPTKPGKTQLQLCMECHDKSIASEVALVAHSMPVSSLNELSQQTSQRLGDHADRQPFATSSQITCNACHREHHGADHDLTAMTNAQCATCHQETFTDFAGEHPEFVDWPYRPKAQIAFDHLAHEGKHFPESNGAQFRCEMCHEQGGATGIVRVNSFEQACASCHEQKLDQGLSEGLAMIALPMIDVALLQQAGFEVGQWPAQAAGSFDGELAPWMRLLLAADRRAWSALEHFGPDFDLLDVDIENVDDMEAVHDIVWGIKQLVFDLVSGVSDNFQQRVERTLKVALSDQQAEALLAQLAQASILELQRQWFPKLLSEVPSYRKRMSLPASGLEGPATIDSQIMVGQLPTVTKLGTAGGKWDRDDQTCRLTLRPQGHASAFVHSWLELLGRNTNQLLPESSWPLRAAFHKQSAMGQCLSCHSPSQTDGHHLNIQWSHRSAPTADSDPVFSLTKFAHGPHLIQPGIEGCVSCHQPNTNRTTNVVTNGSTVTGQHVAGDPSLAWTGDFSPMSKQSCAQCHHPDGAGDSCLKCHDYHAAGIAESDGFLTNP